MEFLSVCCIYDFENDVISLMNGLDLSYEVRFPVWRMLGNGKYCKNDTPASPTLSHTFIVSLSTQVTPIHSQP